MASAPRCYTTGVGMPSVRLPGIILGVGRFSAGQRAEDANGVA
jgi:hypothetical protein